MSGTKRPLRTVNGSAKPAPVLKTTVIKVASMVGYM